jgi:hypothetical protein
MALVDPAEIDFLVAGDGTIAPAREAPENVPGDPPGKVPLTPRPDVGHPETPDDLGKDWMDVPERDQ